MAFTEEVTSALSAKLSEKHVRVRHLAGVTLSYIEGWHAIAEANRIFGYEAWDRETVTLKCISERQSVGTYNCAYLAKVRITVRAGEIDVCREGSGVGHGFGNSPGEAHESAAKEAETDAMKRALTTFGNPFGLALYDREKRGVRKLPRPKKKSDDELRWVVLSEDRKPQCTFVDPLEYLRALRRGIDVRTVAACVKRFEEANAEGMARVVTEFPDLKNGSGDHYVDLLMRYARQKCVASQGKMNGSSEVGSRQLGSSVRPQVLVPPPKRIRDKNYLEFVATLPCIVCGRIPTHAHHLRFAQPRAMGKKVSDEWVVPLCNLHHRSLHDAGREEDWWEKQNVDPLGIAEDLWDNHRGGLTT